MPVSAGPTGVGGSGKTVKTGDLLWVDGCASVQFGGGRALALRVVTVLVERPTFDGWVWLAGYVLDDNGLHRVDHRLSRCVTACPEEREFAFARLPGAS